jgi:hypothetical protein
MARGASGSARPFHGGDFDILDSPEDRGSSPGVILGVGLLGVFWGPEIHSYLIFGVNACIICCDQRVLSIPYLTVGRLGRPEVAFFGPENEISRVCQGSTVSPQGSPRVPPPKSPSKISGRPKCSDL